MVGPGGRTVVDGVVWVNTSGAWLSPATLSVKNISQYNAYTPSHVNWVAVGVA